MKYEVRRWRFRVGEYRDDNGPEFGYFRYDISLGIFDNLNDCVSLIERCEGVSADEIEHIKNEHYQGHMKSTGHLITDLMYRPGYSYTLDGERCYGTIDHDSYWDEYEISEIEKP